MRTGEVVNIAYFGIFTIMALLWALPLHSRIKAVVLGVIGILVTGATALGPATLRDWLPVPVMALAYWQSGCFFQKANPRLQRLFENSDRKILQALRLDLSKWARTWVGALLELAYVFCYPVVPLGVAALYLAGASNAAAWHWAAVLLSVYPG